MHSHEPSGGLPPPPTRSTATHTHIINPAVGCHYFPPGQQLPSQPSGITALRPVLSYTTWWQEAHRCEKLAQSFYAVMPGRDCHGRVTGKIPRQWGAWPRRSRGRMVACSGRRWWLTMELGRRRRASNTIYINKALFSLLKKVMNAESTLWFWQRLEPTTP